MPGYEWEAKAMAWDDLWRWSKVHHGVRQMMIGLAERHGLSGTDPNNATDDGFDNQGMKFCCDRHGLVGRSEWADLHKSTYRDKR